VYVPGGTNSVGTLANEPDALHFLNEAFKHCKAIAADTMAKQVLEETYFYNKIVDDDSTESAIADGIVIGNSNKKFCNQFIKAIAQHRFWEREVSRKVPA